VAQEEDLFWSYVFSRLPWKNRAARRLSTTTHSLLTTALQCTTVILNGPCYPHVIFIRHCCHMVAIKLYLLSVFSRTLNFTLQQQTIRSLTIMLCALYLTKFNFRNSGWYFAHSSVPWFVLPPAVAFHLQSNYKYSFPHSTNWTRRQIPFLQGNSITSSMLQYRQFSKHGFFFPEIHITLHVSTQDRIVKKKL
jgi:hypothetical protein